VHGQRLEQVGAQRLHRAWIRGAAALVHDARFDAHERRAPLDEEAMAVLCMAPTEYRVIAKRAEPRRTPALGGLIAAGEALNPEVLRTWHEATGLWVRGGAALSAGACFPGAGALRTRLLARRGRPPHAPAVCHDQGNEGKECVQIRCGSGVRCSRWWTSPWGCVI
jgi:hypothetical protein